MVKGHLLEDDGLNKTIAAQMLGTAEGQEADDKTVGVDKGATAMD